MDNWQNLEVKHYQDFLENYTLTEKEELMLMYFFEAGLNGLTSRQLASFLNYKSLVNANSIIGRLGRKISQFYNIGISGDEAWWQFVADGEYLSQGFTWYLAEPFAEALMLTGMIKKY